MSSTHKTLAVALVLDHPATDAEEELTLALLTQRLLALGATHVSLIGAGCIRPDAWLIAPKFSRTHSETIAELEDVRHFISESGSLSLVPSKSGQALVLAAAKSIPGLKNLDELSVATLDNQMQKIAGPSPDLAIVSGGVLCLDGSLTWPAGYAEFVFVDMPWSEFTESDLTNAFAEFAARGRRFGGVSNEAAP